MSFLSKIAKVGVTIDKILTDGKVLRWTINKKIKEFGEMLELNFDPKEKKLRLKILLSGEKEPIEININKYIIEKEETTKIKILEASSDRLWLNASLKNFVIGKSFNVPDKAIQYIEEFL
jgi:DNA-binding protein YbaB